MTTTTKPAFVCPTQRAAARAADQEHAEQLAADVAAQILQRGPHYLGFAQTFFSALLDQLDNQSQNRPIFSLLLDELKTDIRDRRIQIKLIGQ